MGTAGSLDSLRLDLKKGSRPFYLFTGDQRWIIDEAVALLRKALAVDMNTSMEYCLIDIKSRWEDVEGLLRNYSFFDGAKLVHLDLPKQISQGFRDSLNTFLEESPGPNTLCLTAPNLKYLMASKNRIAKGGGLAMAFPTLKGKALLEWTRACLRSKGIEFDSDVPARLMERLPVDPGDIASEVEKLSLVVGKTKRLTTEQVERLGN